MSAGGVARPQALANVPAASAASSLCRGRIGRLSRIRSPGANGAGKATMTGARIDLGDHELPAAHFQRIGQRAAGLLVVHGLEREHHIVGGEGMAVRERDVGPQLDRVAQPVVRSRPALGEPGFDLLAHAIDANEPGLGEERDEVGARVARGEPVKGARFGADRYQQLTPATQGCIRFGSGALPCAGSATPGPGGCSHDGEQRSDECSCLTRLSGQKLTRRPENWPIRNVRRFNVGRDFACKMLRLSRALTESAKILAEVNATTEPETQSSW